MIDAMNIELDVLHADGGATVNGFLMQFQADVLRIRTKTRPSAWFASGAER